MDNQDKFSEALNLLFTEIDQAKYDDPKLAPKSKRDAGDNYLGTLPIRLQKLWILRQKAQSELEEIVQKNTDLIECLKCDISDSNGDLPEWKMNEYSAKIQEAVSPLETTLKKWRTLEDVLLALIKFTFGCNPSMPVFGVRSGFKVCCRKDNARGDIYNPLAPLMASFGFGELLKVHEETVRVELPKGTDISKLSPKQILEMILKQMK